MRILLIRTSCRGGFHSLATENSIEIGMAKAICRTGNPCDVVYFGGHNAESLTVAADDGYPPVKVFILRGLALYDTGVFFGLEELAKSYDVVVPLEYDQYESWHLSGTYPEKTVIYHGTYYSDFNRRYNLKCVLVDRLFVPRYRRRGTPFLTKSPLAEEFLRARGIDRVEAVGMGTDISQAESDVLEVPNSLTGLQELKQSGVSVLLYVGTLEPRRNSLMMLEALYRLLEDRGRQVKLAVIGDGDEGYMREWNSLAHDLGVSDSVLHLGKVRHGLMSQAYRASDLLLLPTSYEIFGRVLMESMHYGVPAVTTYNGGSSQMIEDRVNGFIVRSLDAEDWAEVISDAIDVLEYEPSIRERARETVDERFTWDALAPTFIRAFKRFLATKK